MGVGGTLGFAYSEYVWSDCPGISLSGVMEFDIEDLADLSTGEIDLLYLHEMGHVIGVGYMPAFVGHGSRKKPWTLVEVS